MKNMQVFWAEDDIAERNQIRQVFMAHYNSIDLVFFSNGNNLLNALEDAAFLDQLPNLVVIDLNMPEFDGRYVLKNVATHKDLKNVPVVLFSGTNNRMDHFYLQFFNAKRYNKPADPEAYHQAIQDMIAAYLPCNKENHNRAT